MEESIDDQPVRGTRSLAEIYERRNDAELIENIKQCLFAGFEMTDLGKMVYFLGLEVKQSPYEIFICQRKYLKEILKKFQMEECRSVSTPMAAKEKLQKVDGTDVVDASMYRSLIGCLMYLTATRPDILFARGQEFNLQGFSDSDWAGSMDDMKSTSGYCFDFGSACFSWCSKKQEIVAQSTAEVEFIAATAAANQALC
ncbi:uncharacterized mitochondrial protein AtMg00810-like [Eucalyptus grandis]|uniref:uncharacterized mitochondrial protein AtMg00810-like n=1 Tax=Eucalyptus grandis TaxID=71139 RepID=UPI00192E7D78|nr:uncharacterized mitochondrial protein AtMg00810-like [Eucalyptus grandis]